MAPAPHLSSAAQTTRRMMLDVLIALTPLMAVAVWVFHWYAVVQVGICVLTCVAAVVSLAPGSAPAQLRPLVGDMLENLNELQASGAINDEEYEKTKKRLLRQI